MQTNKRSSSVSAETKDLAAQPAVSPDIIGVEPQKCEKKTRTSLKAAHRAYAGQKNPDGSGLNEQQIAQFLPLVHSIAQRAVAYLRPPLTYDDLVSAGTVGLVKAARDYDPSFQAVFKTYAYIRIKGAILDELRGWSFISPAVHKKIHRALDLSAEITKERGAPPSETELAEKLGMSIDEVYQTLDNARAQQFLSIDGSGESPFGGPALANILTEPEAKTPDEQLEQRELIDRLTAAVGQLDERQRQIILLYYQQHLTMKQIAKIFDITEPRVSQLHASAIFNLSVKLRQ
jgi:RNA polymerase sigma factor for flagellar operon FliA